MRKAAIGILLLLALAGAAMGQQQAHLVINTVDTVQKEITFVIQSVKDGSSYSAILDRTEDDNGYINNGFLVNVPLTGKVKFYWWITEYYDGQRKLPKKGFTDGKSYTLESNKWYAIPNQGYDDKGNFEFFLAGELPRIKLAGYNPKTAGDMAHLITGPDTYIATSLDQKGVVAKVPAGKDQSRFDSFVLSFTPGEYSIVHPIDGWADKLEFDMTEKQEFEAGFFYDLLYDNGAVIWANPLVEMDAERVE